MVGSTPAPHNGAGIVGVYLLANSLVRYRLRELRRRAAAVEAAISACPSVINMSWGFVRQATSRSTISCSGTREREPVRFGHRQHAAHFSPPGVPALWPHVLTVDRRTRPEPSATSPARAWHRSRCPGRVDGGGHRRPLLRQLHGRRRNELLPRSSATAAWVATEEPARHPALGAFRTTARDVGAPGWDADTARHPRHPCCSQTPAAADPLEPNDDVNQVSGGGCSDAAAARPGRPRASRSRLTAARTRSTSTAPTCQRDEPCDFGSYPPRTSRYFFSRQRPLLLPEPAQRRSADRRELQPGRNCREPSRTSARAAGTSTLAYKPRDPTTSFLCASIRTTRLAGDAGTGTRETNR
jgi:hypothetical protein